MSEAAGTLDRWRALASATDVVVLDGFHALKHALRFGADVRMALTSDRDALRALSLVLADDVGALIDARVSVVSPEELREVAPRPHPTGVVALANRASDAANRAVLGALPRRAPVVVLDRPRNLGNVGAVVRLVAGFGGTGVITTGELDPWHPNAVRGSAGLHFATAVAGVDIADVPKGPLFALDPHGADIATCVLPDDAVLVFGSERHGVSPELRSRADRFLSIPMAPGVSSFNLATTVAMALFHWRSAREGDST